MKKQLLCIVLFMTTIASVHAQQNYIINGNVKGLKENSKLMLEFRNGGNRVKDSAVVKGGKFVFKGIIDRPVKATLAVSIDGPMTFEKIMAQDKQEFYLDGGKIIVTGINDIKSSKIKGGKTQSEFLILESQLKRYVDQMAPFQEKLMQYQMNKMMHNGKDKNDTVINELLPKLRAIREEMSKVEEDFINQHPDSYVSFDLVAGKAIIIDAKTFEPLYNALSERFRNSEKGKSMGDRLAIAKRTAIGQPAMDFTQKNTKGEPVTLSSLRGKYILLDFWASWCGPCRAENPNVLKAYNKFKDKNFDVLAVSLDDNRDAWLKAIKEDGMPWIHVSDLKGFENKAAVQYGIRAIPQNFLIDPSGKIIASNLRGEKLEEALSKLIKN